MLPRTVDFNLIRTYVLPISILAVLICVVYSEGIAGAFYYDDFANLNGLAKIEDAPSLWRYITSGFAGPSGRPIALFTFALQARDWPHEPLSFLVVNIAIHVANAILLFLISIAILKNATILSSFRQVYKVAFWSALLWAILPINVSTTLVVVQRMTGLAAFFGLLGILIYIYQYGLYKRYSAHIALAIQMATLAIFVLASIYTKESGALIPVFILILEVTLFRGGVAIPGRQPRILLLSISFFSLLYYLSPLHLQWFVVDQSRGFSAWERVRTEWAILWEYIRLTFLPIPSRFSPFHDGVVIIDSSVRTGLAGIAWLSLLVATFLLRRKSVWPLFALLWFFAGHILESTSVLLELYFEHRNYLASYGMCFALVVLLSQLPARYKLIGRVGGGLYMLFIGLVCYATTSIWGQPKLAAEVWSANDIRSTRAALNLAAVDIGVAGGSSTKTHLSFIEASKRDRRVNLLDRTIAVCPECLAVKLQAVILGCGIRTELEIASRFSEALKGAPFAKAQRPAIDAFFPLIQLVDIKACPGVNLVDIQSLIQSLRRNSAYDHQYYASRLLYQSAEIAYRQSNFIQAEITLAEAEAVNPAAVPVLQFQVHLALKVSNWALAYKIVERRRPYARDHFELNNELLNNMMLDINKQSRSGK